MGRGRRFAVATVCAVALGAGLGSSAGAAVVTVGSPMSGTIIPVAFGGAATIANFPLGAPGANATSPITGTIVRWRVGSAVGGPFRLQVLTPEPGGAFTATGISGPATPANDGLQVFATSIPIKAGQTIALNNTQAGDKIGAIAAPASGYLKWEPPLSTGQTLAPTYTSPLGAELTFNADVQSLPVVNLLSPTSGSIAGGTSVGIAGSDFTEVKAVEFGGVPAQSFGVNSDSLITAVAPAAAGPGPVDVSVTTIAGKSATVAGDQFTYTACVVPKLKRKKVKAARKALRNAGCALGKVRKKHGAGKRAKVKTQSAKPGAVLSPGSKINVRVG